MTARWLLHRVLTVVALMSIGAGLVLAGRWLGTEAGLASWPLPLDDPVRVATELVRIAALAAAAWLLVITLVDTMASLAHLHPLVAAVGRLAPAFWREVALKPVAVLALVTPPVLVPLVAITPATAQTQEVHAPDHLTMAARPFDSAAIPVSADAPTLTMRTHPSGDPNATSGADQTPTAGAANPSEPHHSSDGYTVASGDNLWSVAAAHLTAERGIRPRAPEVAPYWRALIDANRDRLPDPDNPDLLFPGIQLRLPPVP